MPNVKHKQASKARFGEEYRTEDGGLDGKRTNDETKYRSRPASDEDARK